MQQLYSHSGLLCGFRTFLPHHGLGFSRMLISMMDIITPCGADERGDTGDEPWTRTVRLRTHPGTDRTATRPRRPLGKCGLSGTAHGNQGSPVTHAPFPKLGAGGQRVFKMTDKRKPCHEPSAAQQYCNTCINRRADYNKNIFQRARAGRSVLPGIAWPQQRGAAEPTASWAPGEQGTRKSAAERRLLRAQLSRSEGQVRRNSPRDTWPLLPVFCEAKLGAHQASRVSKGMNLSRGRGGNETNAHCVPTESSIRQ